MNATPSWGTQAPGSSAPDGFRLGTISLLAALVGVIAGGVAFLLYHLIGFFTNLAFYHVVSFAFRSPAENQLGPWVIGVPVIGGLLIGVMAKYGSPKIKGHGIPEAMEAVLTTKSRVEAKVAFLKPISAAIAIGTGGPFGAEGPIIQTGGAFGSLVGQIVSTTASERKVLLACGAGAGLAAMFNAPITGALLAIELLLFEFQARSFIPLMLACTLAVAVRLRLFGDETMFPVGAFDYNFIHGIPFYLLLGVVCGFAAVGFAATLKWLEEFFDHMKKVPAVLHPGHRGAGAGDHRLFFAQGVRPRVRNDCGRAEYAPGVDGRGVAADMQGRRGADFPGVGDLGRDSGADVHDQRSDWQRFRDGRELFRSRSASFRGGFRGGRDGSAAFGQRARDIHVHGLRH